MNTKLIALLRKIEKETILGRSINTQLERGDIEGCIHMLKGFIEDDPIALKDYLGNEIFNLLNNK